MINYLEVIKMINFLDELPSNVFYDKFRNLFKVTIPNPKCVDLAIEDIRNDVKSWEFSDLRRPLMLELRKRYYVGKNFDVYVDGEVYRFMSTCNGSMPVADNTVIAFKRADHPDQQTEHSNWGMGGAINYGDGYA